VDHFSYGSRNASGTIAVQNTCFLSRINDPFSIPPSLKRTGPRPRPNPVLEASLTVAFHSASVVVATKAARPPGEGETFFENSRRPVTSIPMESGLGFWLQCSSPRFPGGRLFRPLVEAWGFQPREKTRAERAYRCVDSPAACSRVAAREPRAATCGFPHYSAPSITAFLIDIWRLETSVSS
jgi:hypothetical protein